MTEDRRKHERRIPGEFAFIQLDADDGGKVLNFSEGGLSFEAFSPLQPNEKIRCWFSLDLRERIEAVADLAWVDRTGRTGGLKFMEVDGKPCGDWLNSEARQAVQMDEQVQKPVFTVRKRARNASLWKDDIDRQYSNVETPPNPSSSWSTQLVPVEQYHSALRRQLIRGVLLGSILSSLVATAFVKFTYGHKQPDVNLQPASRQEAELNLQIAAGMPPSLTDINRTGSDTISGADKIKPLTAPKPIPANPSDRRDAPQPLQARDFPFGSQVIPVHAQQQAEFSKSLRRNAATPKQLWSLVQAGNVQAAVTLASLYIHGDGVPANCNQARILLLLASEKRNAEAIKKLQELDKTGCPVP